LKESIESMNRRPSIEVLALLGLAAGAQALALQPVAGRAPAGPEALVASATQNFTSSGISLLSQVTAAEMSSSGANDCWGYVSPSGREYAIVATDNGTAWVEISDPSSPDVVVFHDGPDSGWRDVKVFEDFAYAVSEGGSHIQVFDMSAIDSGVVASLGSVGSGGGVSSNSHNVVINEASGYL
jgi:choice-of-anchor B domain-containing protein